MQFAASGLLALVVVAIAAGLVFNDASRDESERDARDLTRALAVAGVEPSLTPELLAEDRQAVEAFDRFVRRRILQDGIVRVKLWTADGRIVYSDERRLIGSRYRLAADDRAVLRTDEVEAEASDLTRPENRFERPYGELVEVYTGVRAPGGQPLLFEAYMRGSDLSASSDRVWRQFAPLLVVALLLLWLVQIPLARSLRDRLRASQEERERLLLHALDASNTERRRIAADLHDGVVQDLAGTALSLSVAAERSESSSRGEMMASLRNGAEQTRQSMRQLRSLLVEIYPPNLHTAGLESALEDLLAQLTARGVDARLDEAGPPVELSRETEQILFRTAQEALRNVAEHADARHARVLLERPDGTVRLSIEDDGRGFTAEALARRRAEDHLGLALLADRAADVGGRLDVDSDPGRGTRVVLEAPVA
ncbi:MAG: sensor histidine kinase [Solirubrobacterales bacterium]|nr:sensor histidine kinase [Solirubrobacterales bacterium]